LTVDGESRGYPKPVVTEAGGVVQDTLGETAIVVFAVPAGLFAYERDELEFEQAPNDDRFEADGTTWDPVTGHSDDGRALTRIPSRQLFAFTWRDDNGPDVFYGVNP
jgi:hypothetical protein